jgi:hypothetical protein
LANETTNPFLARVLKRPLFQDFPVLHTFETNQAKENKTGGGVHPVIRALQLLP